MTYQVFQKELEFRSGKKLRVKINDNHSTMLSVRWESDCAKVSLHRMFLQAPGNVMQALACYLKGEEKFLAPSIKAFIEDNLKNLDYSHEIDSSKLITQGAYYNLQKLYNELNEEYFNNKLNLHITWYGKPYHRGRNRVTFGLYHDPLRLIKIHRLLDSPSFPHFLISYVIYHEMIHHVCPSYVDSNGQHRIHSKEFKELEAKFSHFNQAQRWIKEHHEYLFTDI